MRMQIGYMERIERMQHVRRETGVEPMLFDNLMFFLLASYVSDETWNHCLACAKNMCPALRDTDGAGKINPL